MSMTCKFCGETNPDGTIVCPWCGRRDHEVARAVEEAAAATKRKAEAQKKEAERQARRRERQESGIGAKVLSFMDRRRFLEIYSGLIRDQRHAGPRGTIVLLLIVFAVALPFITLLLIFIN